MRGGPRWSCGTWSASWPSASTTGAGRACSVLDSIVAARSGAARDLRRARLAAARRLRKDPLDPIDTGTKVMLLFKRMTDPEVQRREEEAKRKREEAEKKAKESGGSGTANRGNQKAGAWGGLPPRR